MTNGMLWFDEVWKKGRLSAIDELSLMQQVDAFQPAAQLMPNTA